MRSTYHQMMLGLTRFTRQFVPELENRVPITWRTFPYTLAYFGPLLFMAYLVRRPDTHLIRILMFPTVILLSIHCCWAYYWSYPGMGNFNWALGLCCLIAVGKSIDFVTSPGGHFKVGEKRPGDVKTPAISKKDYDPKDPRTAANGHIPVTGLKRPGSTFLPLWLQDALEVLFAFRGIGWDWGKGVYIPAERKPLEREVFMVATFRSLCFNFLLLDFLESFLKLVPGVGTHTGGTIFLPTLSPLERYSLSTVIHFATGFALLGGIQAVYDLMTLIGVGFLKHSPTSWPPVLDRPWASTSLHEFWARRWHQLLRQTFLVFGGFPGRKTGGTIGMVMGTFIASGFYHEVASITMGRGFNWVVILFFALQGVLVIFERIWRIATGYRVGGWLGTVWVYLVVGILGQPLVDAWHHKGLAGSIILPPQLSPTRQVIFPLLSLLIGRDLVAQSL